MVGTTLWGDTFELFSEHSPATVNHPVSFLIHLTKLEDFRALEAGKLTLELGGPMALRGETSSVLRPGIFRIEVTPKKVGTYHGQLRITGATSGIVEGIELKVFDSAKKAAASASEVEHVGLIEFLKEQQWLVPFNTAFVTKASLTSSVVVNGRIEPPPGGKAIIGAPVIGRLVSPTGGLPPPGAEIKKGQILASLVPAPGSPEAASRVTLALAEAKARQAAAERALERAERLIQDEAISKRALEDARREQAVSQEAVSAAQRGADLYASAQGSGKQGTWHLTAPINGTLTAVMGTPGATVSPGETLFRIVDTRKLWVVARVPEQNALHLRKDRNAHFKVAGSDIWTPITITGDNPTASVVTIGRTVDRVSRTVDVIYSLKDPSHSLRIGGSVQVSVPTHKIFEGITIPRSALIDQDGQSVVYVQVDGEHFQERALRAGPRMGNQVAILDGLQEGERIVIHGAHLIRLADRATSKTPHGHIH